MIGVGVFVALVMSASTPVPTVDQWSTVEGCPSMKRTHTCAECAEALDRALVAEYTNQRTDETKRMEVSDAQLMHCDALVRTRSDECRAKESALPERQKRASRITGKCAVMGITRCDRRDRACRLRNLIDYQNHL